LFLFYFGTKKEKLPMTFSPARARARSISCSPHLLPHGGCHPTANKFLLPPYGLLVGLGAFIHSTLHHPSLAHFIPIPLFLHCHRTGPAPPTSNCRPIGKYCASIYFSFERNNQLFQLTKTRNDTWSVRAISRHWYQTITRLQTPE
jgi:hypothetical protein